MGCLLDRHLLWLKLTPTTLGPQCKIEIEACKMSLGHEKLTFVNGLMLLREPSDGKRVSILSPFLPPAFYHVMTQQEGPAICDPLRPELLHL